MAQRFLGLKLPCDIPVQLAMTVMSRFDADMCLVSLSDSNFYNNRTDCLETLRSSEWGGFVCGLVTQSAWSSESLDRIAHEMSMATHFGLSSVVVPLPGFNEASTVDSKGLLLLEDVALAILRHCNSGGQTKIIIDVGDGLDGAWERYRGLLECLNLDVHGSHTDQRRTWDTFSDVRQRRGAHGMVSAMITLQADSGTFDQRWLGESLSAFVLPLHFSWATSDGVEQAPSSVQRLLSARCSAILDLSGSEHAVNILGVEMLDLTQRTLSELVRAYRERPWKGEEGFAAFEEELQLPLQPLGDHLPNPTYAVFEADEVKYSKYQIAIEAYLSDARGDRSRSIERLHIVVLGAGRGPLVTSTIQALSAKFPGGTRALITIIEKNPFATDHLRLRMSQDSQWVEAVDHGHVCLDLIQGDGRHVGSILRKRVLVGVSPPVDLLVSELLGSIGDNELSPECIEGFMESYCSKDGRANDEAATTAALSRPISIPREYTSYVAPVYSATLLDRVRDLCLKGGLVAHDNPICTFNTMYVVHSRRHLLLAPPQPLLSFSHKLDLAKSGTRGDVFKREGNASFVATHDGVVHGFLGYFECILYNEDADEGEWPIPSLSTNPPTRTNGMYSWFPMFIPLLPGKQSDGTPFSMSVNQGEHIAFELHRHHVKGASVWYEWGATIGVRASKWMNNEGLFGTVTL